VSRAQIARETALSKPTVSQALVTLLDAGLVREAGRTSGGKGPTAVLYELNPQAGWVVGIDVGRDWVRAAIADVTGQFVARRDERAQVKSAKTLITQIGAIAHALASDAGIKWRQVTFAAVGSPGVFERERGQVALAYALPGWGRQGLVELVQHELGTKIAFENDVNLAAIGEQWQGLGKGVDNFVYLHLGTGVGMGMVLNGELYRGSAGAAGEVGYLPLPESSLRDPSSRRRGALDAAASATGVVGDARRLGMPPPLTAKKVFEEARRGDRTARRVVAAERLAMLDDGRRVAVAGLTLVRQRPGTASGVIFITLEDETGIANLVVWPKIFERFRRVVLGAQLMEVHGRLQKEGLVIHVVAEQLVDRSDLLRRLAETDAFEAPVARADRLKPGGGARRRRASFGAPPFEAPLAHADHVKSSGPPDPRDPGPQRREQTLLDDFRAREQAFQAPVARADELKRNTRNVHELHPRLPGFRSRDFH